MLKGNRFDSSAGATTFVAHGTKLVGNISGEGSYIFCGEIDGDCNIDGPVTIAEGSRWKGSVRATDIVLAGTVEGNVTAKHRVEITGTAHITGSLRGSSIIVAEGAVIEGEVCIAPAEQTQRPVASAELRVSPAKS